MRIAVLTTALDGVGGTAETVHGLHEHLARNHEVVTFGSADDPPSRSSVCTVQIRFDLNTVYPHELDRLCRAGELYLRLRRPVRRFEPELIVSHHAAALLGARAATALEIPHVVFLHDERLIPEYAPAVQPLGDAARRVVGPLEEAVTGFVFDGADLFVANSRYLAGRYREHWGIDPAVVYPFVDPDRYRVEQRGEKILHVNPSRYKGIDVTLDVAERLPDEEFLVVGTPPSDDGIRRRLRDAGNVEFRGYVEDMRSAYRDTRLVLMPSRTEAFGRIPVEAGVSGIPTVGAHTGGLPEAIDVDDLLVEVDDPSAYARRITTVFESYDHYAALARRRAREKTARSQFEQFEAALREASILAAPA